MLPVILSRGKISLRTVRSLVFAGRLILFCLVCYRSVVVPVKKPPPGSLSVNTVGTPTTSGAAAAGSTPNIFAAATATPKSMINTTGEREQF